VKEKMMDGILKIFINKKADNFLDKYKGGYFGILTGVVMIYMLTVGTWIYHFMEAPVTIGSIWVSNFGAAKNGAQFIFIAGMLLTILFAIPIFFDLIRLMVPGNENQKSFFILPIACGIGTILGGLLLTIFNMRDYPLYHALSATLFFISAALMVFWFSVLMLFNKKFSKIQAFVGLTAGLMFLIFLVQFIPELMTNGFNIVTIVAELDPALYTNLKIWEWIALIALLIWFMETGVYLLIKF